VTRQWVVRMLCSTVALGGVTPILGLLFLLHFLPADDRLCLARLFESTGGVLPHEASASLTLMAPILLLAPSPADLY
jgi:hypothetical protein